MVTSTTLAAIGVKGAVRAVKRANTSGLTISNPVRVAFDDLAHLQVSQSAFKCGKSFMVHRSLGRVGHISMYSRITLGESKFYSYCEYLCSHTAAIWQS